MSKNKIEEYKEISLFRNPLETLRTILIILTEQLMRFIKFLAGHKFLIVLGVVYLGLNFVEGPHKEVN
jgi:hypothetical protein